MSGVVGVAAGKGLAEILRYGKGGSGRTQRISNQANDILLPSSHCSHCNRPRPSYLGIPPASAGSRLLFLSV